MAYLEIRLLGPFQVWLGGQPAVGFESQKVRALLACLAAEADRPRPRATLAGLLWPDCDDRRALANLRYALKNLRLILGDRTTDPPHLLVMRDAVQFNPASDGWLDLTALAQLARTDQIDMMEQAVALYRGDFLEGFFSTSAALEEWVLCKREQARRQVLAVLERLTARYLGEANYASAIASGRRQLELEPWDETAHQNLMRALALSGQRGLALAQYATCQRLLQDELHVTPARYTRALYESIRDGDFAAVETADMAAAGTSVPFVARESELAQLEGFWRAVLAGHGHPVFVVGDSGSGKTTLMREFARQVMAGDASVVVAQGNGNTRAGAGDSYLPFLDVLQMLTGNAETVGVGGTIGRDHALRLMALLPEAAQALMEGGPDLIDHLVPGADLLARAKSPESGQPVACAAHFEELLGRRKHQPAGGPQPQQANLFEQYCRVLQVLARRHPLILLLDDLQWADAASINLLFYLGRRLAGRRILILGAYRPEDLLAGRDGDQHPLSTVVHEFTRAWGAISVDVMRADGMRFIDTLLDREPNRFSGAFRSALYRQTGGQPLFTIEFLRGLQARGDLVRGSDGMWHEGPNLHWEDMPLRVEAVIAERIESLSPELQRLLAAASVEGEEFTAEVTTRLVHADDSAVLAWLSEDLARRHRLVAAVGCARVNGKRLSTYRFTHCLFQKFLYRRLDPVERARLHELTARALEEAHGGQTDAIAVQLARHFEAAGMKDEAIGCFTRACD